MKCPECGHPDAYKGLLWIHCKNLNCRYFDARYVEQTKKDLGNLSASERLILLREMLKEENGTSGLADSFGPI